MPAWQDLAYAGSNIILGASVIPIILQEYKPPLKTSFSAFAALIIVAITSASLGLFIAAIVNVIGALCWLIVFFQECNRRL